MVKDQEGESREDGGEQVSTRGLPKSGQAGSRNCYSKVIVPRTSVANMSNGTLSDTEAESWVN